MGEDLNLDKALTPDQVRQGREEYKQQYGDADFQKAEPSSQAETQPEPAPRLITTTDIPRAPFIESELERTRTGPEMEVLRKQYSEEYDDPSEQK